MTPFVPMPASNEEYLRAIADVQKKSVDLQRAQHEAWEENRRQMKLREETEIRTRIAYRRDVVERRLAQSSSDGATGAHLGLIWLAVHNSYPAEQNSYPVSHESKYPQASTACESVTGFSPTDSAGSCSSASDSGSSFDSGSSSSGGFD